MKKQLIFVLLILSCAVFAQTLPFAKGTVLESMKVSSNFLGRDNKFSIYLPADYATSQRRYPVLYLLHGYSGNENDWIQSGEANRTADKLIANGDIPDMIIVMPDGQNSWYVNQEVGSEKYADFFIKEFIPYIDKNYRTKAEKGYRAISGLSMGGYGSALFAVKNLDVFQSCAGLSSAIRTDDEVVNVFSDYDFNSRFESIYGKNIKPQDRIGEKWQKNSVLHQMEITPLDSLKKVRWFFDCGDDDILFRGNDALHTLMRKRNIPVEFRMRDGGHTWEYWRTGLVESLKFIGNGFKH